MIWHGDSKSRYSKYFRDYSNLVEKTINIYNIYRYFIYTIHKWLTWIWQCRLFLSVEKTFSRCIEILHPPSPEKYLTTLHNTFSCIDLFRISGFCCDNKFKQLQKFGNSNFKHGYLHLYFCFVWLLSQWSIPT